MVVVEETKTTELIATCICSLSLVLISVIGAAGAHRLWTHEEIRRPLITLFSVCVCSANFYLLGLIINFNFDVLNAGMFIQLSLVALRGCGPLVYLCLLLTLVVRYVIKTPYFVTYA